MEPRNKIADIPEEMMGTRREPSRIDMNQVVGKSHIVLICLDTLRYDVALELQQQGATPNINQFGPWEKRHAPGNFTYPSHHAMFAGFLPSPAEPTPLFQREILFFPKHIGMGSMAPAGAFAFEGSNFVQGLEAVGYHTMCVGGVAFFDKRSAIGNVFPSMFQKSYWNPSFGCGVKESFDNQIRWIEKTVPKVELGKKIFMYLNVDTIHYPNYFYLEGETKDSIKSHGAALRYVDERIQQLFQVFQPLGPTFYILCSDHGTCYGEDGYQFHNVSHEAVFTVPYKQFMMEA